MASSFADIHSLPVSQTNMHNNCLEKCANCACVQMRIKNHLLARRASVREDQDFCQKDASFCVCHHLRPSHKTPVICDRHVFLPHAKRPLVPTPNIRHSLHPRTWSRKRRESRPHETTFRFPRICLSSPDTHSWSKFRH